MRQNYVAVAFTHKSFALETLLSLAKALKYVTLDHITSLKQHGYIYIAKANKTLCGSKLYIFLYAKNH